MNENLLSFLKSVLPTRILKYSPNTTTLDENPLNRKTHLWMAAWAEVVAWQPIYMFHCSAMLLIETSKLKVCIESTFRPQPASILQSHSIGKSQLQVSRPLGAEFIECC